MCFSNHLPHSNPTLQDKTDDLIAKYEGREEDLLKNLRKMSIKADKEAETLAEIKTLMESSEIPEDKCEDLMVKYEGREGDLLKNMRRLSSKALKDAETMDEIKVLIKESDIPSEKADELIVQYEGREEKLLKNLRRMSSSAINPAKEDELNTTADTAAESPARSSPIKNMKGNDYQALIKAKQASSRSAGSTKKLNYNDMIKQKKAEAAAGVATQ